MKDAGNVASINVANGQLEVGCLGTQDTGHRTGNRGFCGRVSGVRGQWLVARCRTQV